MKNDSLQNELKFLLGERYSTSLSARNNFGGGEDVFDPISPQAVVFPENNEEISTILKLCNESLTPVIPYGTGTSLEGNVLGINNGITISLEKMNKVLQINENDFDCRVQAYVTRKQLNEELKSKGVFFPIDPGADASLGGMVATSASGTMAVRYGTMRSVVSGLTVILPNGEIIKNLLEGFSYISEESFEYKTPLSQIYKRNEVDLNCKRHTKIFDTKDIIPEFCFGCFKVQVEVPTFIDLVKLTSLFYKFDFEEDLTKKSIIELRPNISGYYKGLIYCNGLDQAKAVKAILDISLNKVFDEKPISFIKRGCSEYPLKFPSYGEMPKNPKKIMSFPKEWRLLEKKFDQDELIKPKDNIVASLPEFCLSDFYIIQKWIDYAKGIGDKSIEIFNDRPIIFQDVYKAAKDRKKSSVNT